MQLSSKFGNIGAFGSATGMALPLMATVAAMVLAIALFAPASSQARQAHQFTGSFGSASSTTSDPYPLSEPHGVAIDDVTHDVYVTDSGNHWVEKFSETGEFLMAFGADVGGPGVNVCGGLVACTAGTSGSAPGQLTSPTYIAVDNSTGSSQGDVYVADTNDNIVSKYDSSGNLISSWGSGGQLDGSSATSPPAPFAGPFGHLYGVAIDSSGSLWVYDGVHMYEFRPDGGFVTDWGTEQNISYFGPFQSNGIAVDSNNDLYVADAKVYEFNASGGEIGEVDNFEPGEGGLLSSGVETDAIAIDPASGALYLGGAEYHPGGHVTFGVALYEGGCRPVLAQKLTCEPATEFFGVGHVAAGLNVRGLAVDPVTHRVYEIDPEGNAITFASVTVPDVSTVAASNLTPSAVTLDGTVNPDGVELNEGLEGCRFEWGETSAYGQVAACEETAAEIGSGSAPVEVHAEISGLASGKTYHFRLVAGNANDVNEHLDEPVVGQDVLFGPALIESESALNATSTSVTLEAQVNPQNADTHVLLEYGTSTDYGQSTVPIDAGSNDATENLAERIQGLVPDTVYHYRFVASSALGTVVGEDHTFTTQRAGSGVVLPDGREWELVSPPNKQGGVIYPLSALLSQSSLSGGAVTYALSQAEEAGAEGSSNLAQVFSTRATDGGWSSKDIALPRSAAPDGGIEYREFSEDLTTGLVEPLGPFTSLEPNVFPPDSERTPYLRHDATCASEPATCYEPIVTGAEGYEDVPSGTQFGGVELGQQLGNSSGVARFVGGTPDLSHVILESSVQLTETPTPSGAQELYEWSANKPPRERLELVSKDENGQPIGMEGAWIGSESSASGSAGDHAVSADGSRVLWREGQGGGPLYLTSTVSDRTIRLDVVQGGEGTGAVDPEFRLASSDGSRVFFTDTQRLTSDSGAGEGKSDLYECQIVEVGGEPQCQLHDLTPLRGQESGSTVGSLLGSSEDGSWVYFVTNGVLGETAKEGARPGSCGSNALASATCNLYLMHDGASGWEAPRLVAVISAEDSADWGGANVRDLAYLTARVSPDGQWFAFMSQRSLTGYDNRDAASGIPDEEAFLYHAGPSTTGKLVCTSCNPTGARPTGAEDAKISEGLVGNRAWGATQWLAASLPGWTEENGLGGALYQSRYLSDSGRLFFNSSDALSAQDINGNQDVYEFEPVGVGSCTSESSTYNLATGGCVSLISSGRAAGESAFIDASENGNDVFFLTGERLSGQDIDNALDLYDAHVCTDALPCLNETAAPPPCITADSCRSAPLSQPAIFGAPASATFTGTGNLTPTGQTRAVKPKQLTRAQKLVRALRACHEKRSKRKRAACEANARRLYGPGKTTRKVTHKNAKGRK
jgi:NHL repeat/WD40-like Beta Propeller Repeat